jgi:hypothetical protein
MRHFGGGDGTRTHDFFDATEALFQLSYTPERGRFRIADTLDAL